MSLLRRTPSSLPISTAPVTPTSGVCALHLFVDLTPELDGRALVRTLDAATANGMQIVTFAVVGHKAHAGFLLLDADLWALRRTQAGIETAGTRVTNSFLSVTEVSEYAEHLPEVAKRHRLAPGLPPAGSRVIAFYPMSKRRHAGTNWYVLGFDERARLMSSHGAHGRRHAGKVVQLITASTGLDDWEWGVTLFAADPAAIKDVVYELRFDEASALYAEFGPFVVGLLCNPSELASLLPRPKGMSTPT